ncbi:MAG: SbcC/MukB-like Walker B domain-containing protein [Eubacteriales bacterium]
MYKKILTRVRLINWHYFENETVSLNGSTLISGENTAGKSTLLDAIQLVLTINTRKFNTAANEKGNRNLKGYVRCKVGNVGETYLRKNTVISNVALEFYEEKLDKYFVLGVHMSSTDEESAITTKWYIEEVRLEALSFLTGNRPSTHTEFRSKGNKIKYIDQKNAAMDRFKRRLGNLEDRFFDVIPKSLAFKPMDNVKDFINKFILTEENIDVESLRINIENLSELEVVLEQANNKLEMLERIIEKYEEIIRKEKDILVNEFLIEMAQLEDFKEELTKTIEGIQRGKQNLEDSKLQVEELEEEMQCYDDTLTQLKIAANSNESNRLAENSKQRINELDQKIKKAKEDHKKLEQDEKIILELLRLLQGIEIAIISKQEFSFFLEAMEPKKKRANFQEIAHKFTIELDGVRDQYAEIRLELKGLDDKIADLQRRLQELEKRKLQFPTNTLKLKEAIEKEFEKRGINSKVYIVAELLEVTDETWRNAVEGYFNTQKFNLIVEPEQYQIALHVYRKLQDLIHTAGIVNTRKLQLDKQVDSETLAYIVRSENRYVKAYANYVLGRVVRCTIVDELEEHKIAMTPECMLYQGYVVRNLDHNTYKNPYIGQYAYRTQLQNVKRELEEQVEERGSIREEEKQLAAVLELGKQFNPSLIATYLHTPYYLEQYEEMRKKEQLELHSVSKDPTIIELNMKIQRNEELLKETNQKKTRLNISIGRMEGQLEKDVQKSERLQVEYGQLENVHSKKTDTNNECKALAEEKYKLNRKSKTPKNIADNFGPQRTQYANERDQLLNGNQGLSAQQEKFNHKHEQDFLRGMEGIEEYIEAKKKLEAVELVRYEEQLKKAKEDCEQIFKQDFLAKMRNNIESAKSEFRNLNKSLQNIYYGEDSYRFIITFDKKKESLYRMITSENNQEGYSLFTHAFEMEYKEEMDDLFAKLTTKDDQGYAVIKEYTDYRAYLDYDIEIHKRNGTTQKFSMIYGEKSGSETQVPYYVAIAASFYQLYRFDNSVRIMLLDEAFDKMDDERIASMVEFFNSLELQVLMATPPAKIEVIGEQVNTILTAIRVGNRSIVEEYDL